MPRRTSVEERFWAKVDNSAGPNMCWWWTAGAFSRGYGAFRVKGKQVRAHRFAYELTKGPIPGGLQVLHLCDNPLCCNPEHLWLGTDLDNHKDCAAKGRTPRGERHGSHTHPECVLRGERHPCAKLTEAEVLEILRRWRAGGITQQSLADEYGVYQTAISNIVLRKRWSCIPPIEKEGLR